MDYTLIVNHPEFEDAKQDAEMLYFEKGLCLDEAAKAKWINKAIYFFIRNYNRKNSKQTNLSCIAEQCGCEYLDLDSFCCMPYYSEVEDDLTYTMMIEKLAIDDRNILEMYVAGYDYNEISSTFSISNNTARQRIFKIKCRLKIKFAPPIINCLLM